MFKRLRAQVKQHIYKKHQSSELTFSHSNIYILPSKDGFFFVTVALINFILGINYQNNLILATSYIMAVIMVVVLFIAFFNFNNAKIQYLGAEDNFSPYHPTLNLKLSSSSEIQSLRLTSEYNHTPSHIPIIQDEIQIALPITNLSRGKYETGTIKIMSYFPLGLIRTWSYLRPNDVFYIYPTPLPLDEKEQQPSHIPDKNETLSQQQDSASEFDHLTLYQKGMSLSRVAWKHYAKTEQMLVKTHNSNGHFSNQTVFDYDLLLGTKEERLGKLCTQILDADKQQAHYAIKLKQLRIPLGSGNAHKQKCLEALSEF
ncbi:DUF58 domain-containing protein [Pseudoalteromonas peptidolytica]|uniref:DUF58 domain-containing protein n=1 Tax=Pseudoalteromonas peptidolytica F12-50-A1 TaxID=1315280 RepID=A0A8I0MV26_9GAMM|nr:DUF58 domain-containing protein [Pseudoalteromonas peptidolytica]MBE0346404.1 hypothetical protein [Pseudoalteromonas peptidolytica F12-50-A1]NLR14651.1 DUF58 domain-containing protein [Pseudoalteromonas peptidolytica]GEK08962.1 DUF58 domain-containing protein [Pseudoalteromonas peptidolytica]